MFADFLREFALLVAVFAPLDLLLSNGLTQQAFGTIVAIVSVLWGIGAYLGVEPDE